MKIVYCINTLSCVGGIESVILAKAGAFAKDPANKVWIVTCCDDSLRSGFPLPDNVGLIGIRNRITGRFPLSLFQLLAGRRHLKKDLGDILRRLDPDFVISTYGVEKWVLPGIKGGWTTVRELHFVKNHKHMAARSVAGKAGALLADFFDYRLNSRRFDHIVTLTQEDRDSNWKGNPEVSVIPNPVRFNDTAVSSLDNKRIVALGRLVYQKDFPSLIRAFRIVADRFPDWRLDIVGEGEERPVLEDTIRSLSLQDKVSLRGRQSNVTEWLANASIFVMSSRYEGFPLALVEAMACGLPAVSYACPAGPKDIISDGVDGFLVPPGDETALAGRICTLAKDDGLRRKMGEAAIRKAEMYSMENIIGQWTALFGRLKREKEAGR